MPSPSDPVTQAVLVAERPLRLPAHCSTVTAEDMQVRLVLAADLEGAIEIDASDVESIGQAMLQLLVAAHTEARVKNMPFAIHDPSRAFVERVTSCHLADAIGLDLQEGPTL